MTSFKIPKINIGCKDWYAFCLLIAFTIAIYFLLFYLKPYFESFESSSSSASLEGFENKEENVLGKLINPNKTINMFMFYAYDCPHSQKLLQTHWKELQNKYTDSIVFNKIDCYHPDTKHLPKVFNIKNTPAIFMIKEPIGAKNTTDSVDKIEFKGERTMENIEKFILDNISDKNDNRKTKEEFEVEEQNKPTEENTSSPSPTEGATDVDLSDIFFTKTENIGSKDYKYCIKYATRTSSNQCQHINEKENPQVKAWQGAYTMMNQFIKENGKSVDEKKNLAYKIKNHLADWHLCDKTILDSVRKNTEIETNNQQDIDSNAAMQYACGFTK
jgi:hypothetical protein